MIAFGFVFCYPTEVRFQMETFLHNTKITENYEM
jgi:hypothetical protein